MAIKSEKDVKNVLNKPMSAERVLVIADHSVSNMSAYNHNNKDSFVQRMAEWSMTHRISDVIEPKSPTDDDKTISVLIIHLEESKNHMTNITADIITSILDKIN